MRHLKFSIALVLATVALSGCIILPYGGGGYHHHHGYYQDDRGYGR